MKKLLILISVLLSLTYCNGPRSGPLQKDSFAKKDKNQDLSDQIHNVKVKTEKIDVVIEPCEGCIAISRLLENKESFSGKVIRVKGKITKYNPAIMGKNWIHIQDGSEYKGGFDLTITTDAEANVGDIMTFEGKVVLNKDFGYGYFYNVLMEEAKPVI